MWRQFRRAAISVVDALRVLDEDWMTPLRAMSDEVFLSLAQSRGAPNVALKIAVPWLVINSQSFIVCLTTPFRIVSALPFVR
jgi:hypothetical protein